MKKALILATTGGFFYQFEYRNAELLRSMGYEVHYAANFAYRTYGLAANRETTGTRADLLHQISLKRSPYRVIPNLMAILQLRKLLQTERFDLLHCHNPMGGAVGRLAAGFLPRAVRPYVIYTAHGFHFYQGAPRRNHLVYRTAECLLARLTDLLITINHEDAAAARQFHMRPGGRVVRIPGAGVDLVRFRARPEQRKAVRQELGIPEGAFHLVSASELNRNKNLETVLRGIALANCANLYYSICGTGAEENHLRAVIRQFHLTDRVRLLGYRADMERMLQSADAFVFPSLREGLGIAAIEALACGVPLIVSDNRGTREYACDGVNSIVCRQNTAEEYAGAIRRLADDPELRARLAANCRSSAERFGYARTEAVMRRAYRRADQTIRGAEC